VRRDSTATLFGRTPVNGRLRLVLTSVAVLGALLALSPAAIAAKRTVATAGGAAGVAGGQFNAPRGIAVNQTGNGAAAGTFYVVDASNARIQQFSPGGAFVRAWGWGVRSGEAQFEVCAVAANCLKGAGGNNAGQLNNPLGIAVDQATGNVFVANSGSRRISIYKANGTFYGAFGWGAINGGASLQFCTTLTGCGNPGTAAPTSGNVGGGQFGTLIGGLATDAGGNLYVANRTSRRIDVFKPVLSGTIVTGIEFLRSFGWGAATGAAEFQVCVASPCKAPAAAGTGLGQFGTNSPADVSVDSEANVLALDSGNFRVQKFSPAPAPLDKELGAVALAGVFNNGPTKGNLIALAVEPETDHVLVLGNRAASDSKVAIAELTAAGVAVETHGTDSTVTVAAGLGVTRPALGGTLYFSSSGESQQRLFVLNDTTPIIEPPTGISATEATFHGQVVSKEVESSYRFEYSADGGATWITAPQPDAVVPAQPGSVPVEQTVSGLEPNTKYQVRLVANRPKAGWGLATATSAFATDKTAPVVEGVNATQLTGSGARLIAYINPRNDSTSYHFEYGTTPAYGAVAPIPDAAAGKGGGITTVSQLISGLTPNTTYHFRVVATNSSGQAVSLDSTFESGSVSPAPPTRAFELVSPPEKGGIDVNQSTTAQGVFGPVATPDGEEVAFAAAGSFPGSVSNGGITTFHSARGIGGWDTTSLSPPQNPVPGLGGSFFQGFSRDLGKSVLLGPVSPQPAPDASEGTPNLFLLDNSTGAYRTISLGTPTGEPGLSLESMGTSDDLGHVVFMVNSPFQLVEDAPVGVSQLLYDWDAATGSLDLVGRMPVTDEPGPFAVSLASRLPNANAVSQDGSRIFFNTPQNPGERDLYVRVGGTSTQYVSASQATIPDPNGSKDAVFRWASADGAVVFFTSAEKLTDDATTGPASSGSDLYRYEVATKELTDITVDGADTDGAEVQGVLGASEDGTSVYFAARGVLAEGAAAGADNLYLWTDDGSAKGSIEFVAADAAPANWQSEQSFSTRVPSRVTSDGRRLLFTSTSSLTGYPNAGHLEAYLFDATSDQLACASCNPLGGPATADVEVLGTGDVPQQARTLSADGSKVFFTTAEALTPADENTAKDVYEFDAGSGRVTLLSSGESEYPSLFQDAGEDGRDVFFTTREQLVGIDLDENVDVYDARVGGGLPSQSPPPPPPPCSGEECLPPVVPAAAAAPPSSAVLQGPVNQVEHRKRHKKKRCKQMKKKQRKHCANKRNGRR
jgi:hypothetical protein